LGEFIVTLDCVCGWPIGILIDHMQGNPDVGPLGMVLGSMQENTSFPLKSAPIYSTVHV